MANDFVRVPADGVGKRVDNESFTRGADTIYRQRVRVGGAADADLAAVDTTNGLDVDVTRVIPGTTATALGKAQNAAYAASDVGVALIGVRRDVPTAPATAAGQYGMIQLDDLGGVRMGAPNNRAASGTLNALNAELQLIGDGLGSVEWEIDTGTLVGTVVFEASLSDTGWFAINAVRIDGTIISSTTTFADRGTLSPVGYSRYRLRVSLYTSGSSACRMEGAVSADTVRLGSALPTGVNLIGGVYSSFGNWSVGNGSVSDVYTATGNGTLIDATLAPVKHFGIQVTGTGGVATTWDVRLEGSLDGVGFTQIIQHTQVDLDTVTKWSGANPFAVRSFRSRCAGLVLGPATNIVVWIVGVQ